MRRSLLILPLVFVVFAPATLLGASASSSAVTVSIASGPLRVVASTSTILFDPPLEGATESVALNAPVVRIIDASGTGAGWQVSMQATALTVGGIGVPVEGLRYGGGAGTIRGIAGKAIDRVAGPLEVRHSQVADLARAVPVVMAARHAGMGTYEWTPAAEAFRLRSSDALIECGCRAEATLVFTITAGP